MFLSIPFDQDRWNQEITLYEYPLNIVEHPGSIGFVKTLQTQFNMVSFNTIQGDCVATYQREKGNLLKFLSGIPRRVCVTLN